MIKKITILLWKQGSTVDIFMRSKTFLKSEKYHEETLDPMKTRIKLN